jgi:hypothetical protein
MRTYSLIFLLLSSLVLEAQVDYNHYFTGERLRFDYGIMGLAISTKVIGLNIFREKLWGGSERNLLDTMQYGDFMLELYDSTSNTLIYSRGYSSLFREWKTTREAEEKERLFLESVVMPFPKKPVKMMLLERNFSMQFDSIYCTYLNPQRELIEKISAPDNIEIRHLLWNGSPASKVDIVILAEGYTPGEKEKFYRDVEHIQEVFFQWRPYDSLSDRFNITAVFTPSDESGTDIPQNNHWVNTSLNSHFNTFGTERYLTCEDVFRVRDLLSETPYDQICLMVNTDWYGGGGIYNYYTIFTSDHQDTEFLFHHEYGHAFAGLADEYFTSEVAYHNMFNLEKEPYQPNITTLIDFAHKWQSMVSDTVPVPTPNIRKYAGVVGVFEGAGYSAEGIYRPYLNCTMKSVLYNGFCPVCAKAIERMIFFYSE